MIKVVKLQNFIFAGVVLFTLVLGKGYSGTVNYSNVSGLNYDFINIKEVSSLDTFLGAPRPAPNPAIDTLVISGGTLQVLTPSTSASDINVVQHAATTYSFDVLSKVSSTSIDRLKISMGGQYALNSINLGATNNYAMVSIQIPMTIQLLAAAGTPIESAPIEGTTGTLPGNLPNFIILPSSVTVSANGIGNVDSRNGTWSANWETVQNINELFNLPTMKISQLTLSVTPDLMGFRSISDLNTASVTLTNATFQVIPEPTSTSLFAFGSALLLLNRRKKRLDP